MRGQSGGPFLSKATRGLHGGRWGAQVCACDDKPVRGQSGAPTYEESRGSMIRGRCEVGAGVGMLRDIKNSGSKSSLP